MWKYMNLTPEVFVGNYEQGLKRVLGGKLNHILINKLVCYCSNCQKKHVLIFLSLLY